MLIAIAMVLTGMPCEVIEIDASVAPSLRRISGTLECIRPTAPLSQIEVWNYPAHLGAGTHLPDNEVSWTYPKGFSLAQMTIRQGEEGPESSNKRFRLQAGTDGDESVVLHFTTDIPLRNGAFAHKDGTLFLGGGWFPRLIATGLGSEPLIYYDISFPKPLLGFVGNKRIRNQRRVEGRFRGMDLPIVLTHSLETHLGPKSVILVASKKHRRKAEIPFHLKEVFSYRDQLAIEALQETLLEGRAFAEGLGIRTPPLLVAHAPLRQNLVESNEVGFFVSDRAFHLWDYEPLRKFHRLQVWHSQLLFYVRATFSGVASDPRREQNAEFLTAALMDKLLFERYGQAEYAAELLEPFAVIPQIESLVYAPQVPFRTTYYKAIYDETRSQSSPFTFHSSANPGSLLYEKLVDDIGRPAAQELLQRFLSQQLPWSLFLSEELEQSSLRFLEFWREGYPRLDYSVSLIGTDSDNTTSIRVAESGPDKGKVKEPIRVTLEDRNGEARSQVRRGPGVLTFSGVERPQEIQLDPEKRLVELYSEPGMDPRFNNRVEPEWNFLLHNISGLFSLTDAGLSAGVDFSLRRNYDLKWKYNFAGFYLPSALGVSVSGTYSFGEKLTPLRLAKQLRLGLTLSHLRREAQDGDQGFQLSAGVFYRYDTRMNVFSSFRGEGLAARVVAAATQTKGGLNYSSAQFGLSGVYLWQLGAGQALAGRLRLDATLGTSPAQNGFQLGGIATGGRGFEMNQLRGRRRVVATVEHRHSLVSGMRTDFAGFFTMTGIEGAFFADGIYLDQENAWQLPSAPVGCGHQVFADAGYGLRFLVDLGNVAPAALNIDVGTPLTRCGQVRNASPVTIYISFVQSLLSF